jgi:arylsulfatase A-like enzyme
MFRRAGLLAAIAMVACDPGSTGEGSWPDPGSAGRPTDTIPAFYGKVPKNVLILSVDTFRRDHAGLYAPGTMPFLEQIMREGFTLDNQMECANWTLMGTACSVNGRHNEENGFIPELGGMRAVLPDGPTLASALSSHGWFTVLSSGNSWFSADWNNAQGFDEAQLTAGAAVSIYGLGQSMLEAATLRGEVDDGWMLHAHLMEPHAPYAPPAEYLRDEAALPPISWDLANKNEHYDATAEWPQLTAEQQSNLEAHLQLRYQAELTYLDDQLRTIFADLTTRGMLDDTLVVIFNDHGEQIFDHGNESHAYGLYHEENDGIAIFWSQNIVPGAWTGPTSQIDLAPTILGLLDVEIPREMTGIPLGEAPEDRPTFATTSARLNTIQSVRKNGLKLIFTWATGHVEMYDEAADPLEQNDVFDPTDPVAQDLWSDLLPHIEMAEPIVFDDVLIWPAGLPRPDDLATGDTGGTTP